MNEELVNQISSHFGLENDTRRLDIVYKMFINFELKMF